MERVKLYIDPKGLTAKPTNTEWGLVSTRIFQKTCLTSVTIQELEQKIRAGHTICPALMKGSKATDWQTQQVFMVDIDNADSTKPVLTIKRALEVCAENGITPAIYYQTFSYQKEQPKFRLVFVTAEVITDPNVRQQIAEKLVSLFPQSDRACTNSNRIFLGTNKKVILHDENARLSADWVIAASTPATPRKHCSAQNYNTETRNDSELEAIIRSFDFLSYLAERNGAYSENGNTTYFKNCEICGHKDDLRYYKDTNTFYCFSTSGGVGGSIIDYLIAAEKLTPAQARKRLMFELVDPWETPKPLADFDLPVFPVECLPPPLQNWVKAVSENTQTPLDMAGVASLAAIATAAQGKYKVRQSKDHNEPLNLFILIIAKPAERKSKIVSIMTDCIFQYEQEENWKRKPIIDEQEAKLKVLTRKLERAKSMEEANALKTQIREIELNRVHFLRINADDVTSEALITLLANNNGVLSIISAEGGLFDTLLGRYSGTPSIDTVLKGHNQDHIRVDRKGSGNETVDEATLTILLSAQENVLRSFLSEEIFRARGLTARFLYCIPVSKMGTRLFETPDIPTKLKKEYELLIRSLLEIPVPQKPSLIRLSDEALALLREHFYWVEPQLIGALEDMSDWGGKLVGATVRIAGILHCAENKQKATLVSISGKTMSNAIAMSKYFLAHAKYAYAQYGANRVLEDARLIQKALSKQTNLECTSYQILRLCRHFKKVEEMQPALELLTEYSYIKPFWDGSISGGRPKGISYILNPKFFDKRKGADHGFKAS